jgi:hypothetical protein
MAKADFYYEPYVQVDPVNLELVRQYFDTLGDNDVSKKYYNGQVYQAPTGLVGRLLNFTQLSAKLHTLQRFYPHQKAITQTMEDYEDDSKAYASTYLIPFKRNCLLVDCCILDLPLPVRQERAGSSLLQEDWEVPPHQQTG